MGGLKEVMYYMFHPVQLRSIIQWYVNSTSIVLPFFFHSPMIASIQHAKP